MEDLIEIARVVRRETFEMVLRAGRGHLGGSLSCVEILVALFAGGALRVDSKNPDWPDRDRFILSKGHANNSLYVLLAHLGFFPRKELDGYLTDGSRLGMHIDRRLPGMETVSGSLGHGLGIGAGLALGARLDGRDFRTVVLMGDGESQEGSVWEAAMFARQHQLGNLTAITDRNQLGSEDFTENTACLEPLSARWASFGWEVRTVDGHSFPAILDALEDIHNRVDPRPLMIIAQTIKGKGISSLENKPHSHHTLPTGRDIDAARRDLQ